MRRIVVAGLLAAGLVSFGHAGVKLGRKHGAVGLDGRLPWGESSQTRETSVPIEPVFRAGVEILPNLAAGAELGFVWAGSPLDSPTNLCFGPTVTWFAPRLAGVVQPYVLGGWAFVYHSRGAHGSQVKLASGGVLIHGPRPIAAGFEFGCCSRRLNLNGQGEPLALTANAVFIGIRMMGLEP